MRSNGRVRQLRWRAALVPALFVSLGALSAWSADISELKYPGFGDSSITMQEDLWRKKFTDWEDEDGDPVESAPDIETCGETTIAVTGKNFTRDPRKSTPRSGPWRDMLEDRNLVPDNDNRGRWDSSPTTYIGREENTIVYNPSPTEDTRRYVVWKFVVHHANVFAFVRIQMNNGEQYEWKIRYVGDETAVISEPSATEQAKYSVSNQMSWEFTSNAIDLDSKYDNDVSEKKRIVQNWGLICQLIDGTKHTAGRRFEYNNPSGWSSGIALGFDAKPGKNTSVIPGFGLTYSNTQSGQTFVENPDQGEGDASAGPITGDLGCPQTYKAFCRTFFNADFEVNDNDAAGGSEGGASSSYCRLRTT